MSWLANRNFILFVVFTVIACGAIIAKCNETQQLQKSYNDVVKSQSGNAAVLLVMDGCRSCKRLENDLIPILRSAGIIDDSVIVILSVEKQPELVRQLMGSEQQQARGFPVLLIYRMKDNGQGCWRYIGYDSSSNIVNWLHGIKLWKQE
jgi:hypothetical protein